MTCLQLTRRSTVHPLIEQAARAYCDFHEHEPFNALKVSAAAGRMFVSVADRYAFRQRVAAIYDQGVAA